MNDRQIFITVSIITILGQLFTLGVVCWQLVSNLWGFWFWFSLVATFGYGIATASLRDLDNLVKKHSKNIGKVTR